MSTRAPGIYPGISNDEYHSDNEWISSSQLKVALQGPYHYNYFVRQRLGTKKETDSKNFGSITHKLVLEPDDFHNEYAVMPNVALDMRRGADKEKVEAFKQEHAGKTVITYDDYSKAVTCRDSVMSHPDAKRLLETQGDAEVSCYTELDHTLPDGEVIPFKVRVRPDKLSRGCHILDLKTAKNPSKDGFIRDAFGMWGYHYDLSAALYVMALEKLTGEAMPFYWIVVKNDQPWECAVYKMKMDTFLQGLKKMKQSMTTILMAEKSGKWVYQERMEDV